MACMVSSSSPGMMMRSMNASLADGLQRRRCTQFATTTTEGRLMLSRMPGRSRGSMMSDRRSAFGEAWSTTSCGLGSERQGSAAGGWWSHSWEAASCSNRTVAHLIKGPQGGADCVGELR